MDLLACSLASGDIGSYWRLSRKWGRYLCSHSPQAFHITFRPKFQVNADHLFTLDPTFDNWYSTYHKPNWMLLLLTLPFPWQPYLSPFTFPFRKRSMIVLPITHVDTSFAVDFKPWILPHKEVFLNVRIAWWQRAVWSRSVIRYMLWISLLLRVFFFCVVFTPFLILVMNLRISKDVGSYFFQI